MKPIKIGHSYQLKTPIVGATEKAISKKVEQNSFSQSFAYHLQQTLSKADVRFSQHARDRLEERGIYITQDHVERINQGLNKAQAKGAKESLFLVDELAFVISVKNQTVITAMEREDMQDHMITNIDSAVLL